MERQLSTSLKKKIKKFIERKLQLMAEGRGYILTKKPDQNLINELELYAKLFPKLSLDKKRFYNIGAGQFKHPYWTNIEKTTDWYQGVTSSDRNYIEHDLLSLKKIPVKTETAELVYSSHTIEHIPDEAAEVMLKEAYRILKPGGILRFTTPDIDLVYAAYKRDDRHFFYWIDRFSIPGEFEKSYTKPLKDVSIQQIFLEYFASHASELSPYSDLSKISDEELDKIFKEMEFEKALNYCTSRYTREIHEKSPGLHVSWWNFKKARRILEEIGFKMIYRSGYGQSTCPVLRNLRLFDGTHPKVSLYIEAVK